MVQFSTYYNQTLHSLKAYWGHLITNSPLSTTTVESSGLVSLPNSTTYNRASTSFSRYSVHKNYITITDINLPNLLVGFDKKHILSSSESAVTQHNRAVTAKSIPYHEPQTDPYLSGLDFLFPPEKKTKCAIFVTPTDKQQRLINFSDRVHHKWIRPYQLIESSGELKCTQVRTGERDYDSFLFYFVIVSLLLNIILGIYMKCKYGGFQTLVPGEAAAQENAAAVPNPRNYREHAALTNPKNVNPETIAPNPPRNNEQNVAPNPDQENISPRQGYNPGGELKQGLENLLQRVREMRRNNEQQVLPVRRDIGLLRPNNNL